MKTIFALASFVLIASNIVIPFRGYAKTPPTSIESIDTIIPRLLPGDNNKGLNLHPITPPAKISFEAVTTSPHSRSSTAQLSFDAVNSNDGNAFNLSTGEFVAPTNGLYFLSVNLLWNGFGCNYGAGGSMSLSVLKNRRTELQNYSCAARNNPSESFTTSLSFSVKLVAGDRITLMTIPGLCDASGGGGTLPELRKAIFSGFRVYSD
jgi:hypothetical protein